MPFPALDPAAITAEKDTVPRCHNFGSSVPFGLLQSANFTALCSSGSQQGVDVADIVNAVDRCCANLERAKRAAETSPWRPCVLCGPPSSPPAPLVTFSDQMSSAFHSVSCPCVFYPGSCPRFSDVLGAALPPRLDFSTVDTLGYWRGPS